MATSSTNLVTTLGAGSGIDIKSLAQQLADAEKKPRADAINKKVTETQNRITGYGALKLALSDLKTAFSKLNDTSDFASVKASSNLASSVGISASSVAKPGIYDVTVSALAQAQRRVAEFASNSISLNSGSPFSVSITSSGTTKTVSVTTDTPDGIAQAINDSVDMQSLGISAQVINTGSKARLVLTGKSGASNGFDAPIATPNSVALGFGAAGTNTAIGEQTPQDASFSVNGINITRSSNTVSDVVSGVTLDLMATTVSTVPGNPPVVTTNTARLTLTRDPSAVKANVKAMVAAYNDFEDGLKILEDRSSKVEQYGGALAGENTVRTVRSALRNLITSDSSSAGTTIQALRDIGVSLDRNGKMQLDEAKFDKAASAKFDEMVKMLTANQDNQSLSAIAPGGAAGDIVKKLDSLIRTTGFIPAQTRIAESRLAQYKADLQKLDDRMQAVLDRYIRQFAAMDSVVGQSTSIRNNLKTTFENMSNQSGS